MLDTLIGITCIVAIVAMSVSLCESWGRRKTLKIARGLMRESLDRRHVESLMANVGSQPDGQEGSEK